MCGLTGIVTGKKYKNDELERVKELFTQVLLAHEERGAEATGICAIRPHGSYTILKKPIPAGEFIKTEDYRDFLRAWDNNVSILLGHTRKPTKGPAFNNANNHPIIVGDTIGIHNGTISNDDWVFAKEQMERKAEVDSEVIFSLLDNVYLEYNSNHEGFISQIQAATKKMTGTFTTISVNLKHPGEILILKYNQPLSYHYSKNLETLFFTSRYLFLRKAFGRAVITEALPGKSAYVFNLFSNSQPRGTPFLSFPISSGDEADV